MNDQAITAFIIQTVIQRPFILGSQLGASVKKAFPWFRGLREYISHSCADQIVCVGMHGPDFVYAHVSQAQQRPQPAVPRPDLLPRAEPLAEPASSREQQTPPAQPPAPASVGARVGSPASFVFMPFPKRKPITFWAAFTNPNLDSRLVLDKESAQLVVLPRGSRLQSTFEEVPKVTIDEHNKIIQDFLPHIDPPDRQYFQQVASAPNSRPPDIA